jgi:hypothetical protein
MPRGTFLRRLLRAWANLHTLRDVTGFVSTLDELKAELRSLKPGRTMGVRANAYPKLLDANPDVDAGATQRMLMREYNCEVQFRGDGMVWFVKNGTSN